MKFNLLDSIMYYLSLTILIILTPIQMYSFYQTILNLRTANIDPELVGRSVIMFLFSIFALMIVLTVLFIQMLRIDYSTDFTTNVRRFAKFGLITIGGGLLYLFFTFIRSLGEEFGILGFLSSILIIGLIILVYIIGSSTFVFVLSPKNDGEKSIHRGLIITQVGLIGSLLSLIIGRFIVMYIGTNIYIIYAICFFLLIGGLIYSNYAVKSFKLTGIEISDEDMELYKPANQQS